MAAPDQPPDSSTLPEKTGPNDLVRGLRLFAALGGGLSLIGFLFRLIGQGFVQQGGWTLAEYVQNGIETTVLIAIASATWALVGRPEMKDKLRTVFGATLYVAMGAITAYHDILDLDPSRPAASASIIGLIALIYPLLVPASRRHHLLLLGLCAAYLPIGAAVAFLMSSYGTVPAVAVILGALAMALPTWVACGVAAWVVLEQERRRRRLGDIEEDLAQLGSYTLERKIGQGGMGEVWRARHAFLARPAALKLIRAKALVGGNSAEDAQERARILITRFEREAQATAKLTSPHTVQIHDFGRLDNDVFFYVMELLDGTDLWSLVARFGPLPEELVHHMLLEACDSLGEAHLHGLIHRDLKPANLFLCRKGLRLDVTKVLDFGLVKSPAALRGDRTETHMRLTQQGMVSGTPAYMSPEQASGSRDLDGRSDLYALACVAYFLLTGQDVFDDKNSIRVMLAQIERTPVPMRVRNPNLQLSPDFEAILMRLLQKNREDRYEDASAMAEALRQCVLKQPWTQQAALEWWTKVSGTGAGPLQPQGGPTDGAVPPLEARQLRARRSHAR